MHEQRFFCALESRANHENIYATVARIRSWLLIEYPSAWRRNAVDDSRLLSPETKARIRRLPVDRTLLIRQHHRATGPIRCYLVQSCQEPPSTLGYTISDYDRLPNLDEPGEPVEELMFAVCTHGNHDKCCAKFGMPVWCAFRDLGGRRAWQCSHVGGDRFAANVVVFPYGIYYGRVQPDDVAEILHSSDAGQIWMPGFCGRACHPRAVQAGEFFVRRESGRTAIDELRPLAVERTAADVTTVSFEAASDGTMHTVEFVTRPDALVQRLTCTAPEQSAVAQYELRRYLCR